MNEGQYIFAELTDFLPRRQFDSITVEYSGNKYVKSYKMSIINTFTENRIENSYEIEDKLFVSELHQYITLLIESLPPRQKEIFLLSRNEELSYQEIADRLQISIKTVEHSISKSLKYLKKNIPLIYIFFVCC